MNTIAQIFPRTGRISGPEVTDGAKPGVPTTDVENEKKKKTCILCRYFQSRINGLSLGDFSKRQIK